MPHLGEMLALLAPMAWSVAVILYRVSGQRVPAPALNVFKNVLASLLFVITALGAGLGLDPRGHGADIALLLLSGALGIGASDMLFFMCLNRVGAGLQAIINTSYSPSIILLSMIFLHERLGSLQIAGVVLILAAVLSVSWMRGPRTDLPRRRLIAGVGFGLLATLTQAISIVMIKPLLGETSLLWANVWRTVGGLLAAASLMVVPALRAGLPRLRERRSLAVVIPATVMGTYVALMLWLGGMKYTQASTASALNQTASLWTFLLAVLVLREPVTRRRIVGLVVGVGGVAMVTFG